MTQNVWKGLLAGAIAGLVGTAVKTLWEEFAPPRAENADSPPLILADRLKEQTTGGTVSEKNKPIVVKAHLPSQVMALGGEPIGERFLFWNFVSSSKERIEQAKEDWRLQRMKLPLGDDQEFTPLP